MSTSAEPGEILSDEEEIVHTSSRVIRPGIQVKTKQKQQQQQPSTVNEEAGHQVNVLNKFRHLKDDPDFNDFLNVVLDKKLSDKMSEKGKSFKQNTVKGTEIINTNVNRNSQPVKSPSDTTLYTPGLSRGLNHDNNAIEKISNFVESIRIDGSAKQNKGHGKPYTPDRADRAAASTSQKGQSRPGNGEVNMITPASSSSRRVIHDATQEENSAEKTADQLLLQAEKFKARVEAPKGIVNSMLMPYDYDKLKTKFVTDKGLGPIDNEILFLRNFDQYDEFFHVTSQIEPSLKAKIERGEFVDLDRLLPKDRFSSNLRNGSDELNKQLFQLITQGTQTYMGVPDNRNNKVNTLKKWDQAFRVFAAIYSQANPDRAGEIWQYIYVIHTAAASNPWENVSFYDITFRELMASKPWRS